MPLAFSQWHLYRLDFMVRLKGLEPTRLSTQEPKSCMSTNSITGAYSI